MTNTRRRVTLVLDVEEDIDLGEDLFETRLTHPNLLGELTFKHSRARNREDILKAIDTNLVAGVLDIADLVGGLIDGRRQTTRKTAAVTADLSPGQATATRHGTSSGDTGATPKG